MQEASSHCFWIFLNVVFTQSHYRRFISLGDCRKSKKTFEFKKDVLFRSSTFSFPMIIEDIQVTDVGSLNGTVTCINQFSFCPPNTGFWLAK